MDKIFFHIDVNSAFLSWTAIEQLNNGSTIDLRQIPSIIGGDLKTRHGIVLAKSIPAKKYGITTGEPVVSACRKCPNLTVISPSKNLYSEKSHALMEYLSNICPEIEQVSIDECYMDFTPICKMYSSPEEAARIIKDGVRETFGFTVNVGISDRKVLAKMASDFKKPDLVHTLYHNEIQKKMWPLPISSLFMCGNSSVEALRNLGIRTIGNLAQMDLNVLCSYLKSHGKMLWEFANGIDDSIVVTTPSEVKGVGNSTTLTNDISTIEEIKPILLKLSESVARRLRKAGKCAYMVSVELKFHNFQSSSHQTTISQPVNTSDSIYKIALQLLDDFWDFTPVRLVGIRTSRLVDETTPVQMELTDFISISNNSISKSKSGSTKKAASPNLEKQLKLDSALDAIREKYGKDAVVRGSLKT